MITFKNYLISINIYIYIQMNNFKIPQTKKNVNVKINNPIIYDRSFAIIQ